MGKLSMSREQERLFRGNPLEIGKRYNMSGVGDHGIDPDARPFIGQDLLVTQLLKSGLYITKLPDGNTYAFPKSALWPIKEETYDYLNHRSTVMKTVQEGTLLDAYKRALDTENTRAIFVSFDDVEFINQQVESVCNDYEMAEEQVQELLDKHKSSVMVISFDPEETLTEIVSTVKSFTEGDGNFAIVTPSQAILTAIKEAFV